MAEMKSSTGNDVMDPVNTLSSFQPWLELNDPRSPIFDNHNDLRLK